MRSENNIIIFNRVDFIIRDKIIKMLFLYIIQISQVSVMFTTEFGTEPHESLIDVDKVEYLHMIILGNYLILSPF